MKLEIEIDGDKVVALILIARQKKNPSTTKEDITKEVIAAHIEKGISEEYRDSVVNGLRIEAVKTKALINDSIKVNFEKIKTVSDLRVIEERRLEAEKLNS